MRRTPESLDYKEVLELDLIILYVDGRTERRRESIGFLNSRVSRYVSGISLDMEDISDVSKDIHFVLSIDGSIGSIT